MKTGEPPIKACSKKRSSFRSLYLNMLSRLKRIINGNYFDRLFYIFFFSRALGKALCNHKNANFREIDSDVAKV